MTAATQRKSILSHGTEIEPKYDIRSFSPNREKCGKGITLNADEAAALLKALQKELNSED